jgi:predicted nucleic acid-binding protein
LTPRVATKWVVEKVHSDEATLLLAYDALHAPDHWRAAAVNVLWAKVFRGDLATADTEEPMSVLMPVVTADARLMRQPESDAALANRTVWIGNLSA